MSSSSDAKPTKPEPVSVHVQVDAELRRWLDTVRATIQSSLRTHLVVSRGDVLRLALRRLVLSYLAHLSESGVDKEVSDAWHATVAAIHADDTCPDWLMPGRAEVQAVDAKPIRSGKTRKRKE